MGEGRQIVRRQGRLSIELQRRSLTIHVDGAIERNLLLDEAFGKTPRLGILDEVRNFIGRRIRLDGQMRVHAIPAIEYRALEHRTAEKFAKTNLAARIADLQ